MVTQTDTVFGLAQFINRDGDIVDWSGEGAVGVAQVQGAWGGPLWTPKYETSYDGRRRALSGIMIQGDALVIHTEILIGAGVKPWDLLDPLASALRPYLNDGKPNTGIITYERPAWTITTPDKWRRVVAPAGFRWEPKDAGYTLNVEMRFETLEDSWLDDVVTVQQLKANGDATWATTTQNVVVGGDMDTEPTWYIGGPTAGPPIDSISITNNTTGETLGWFGVSIATGQEMAITTGFLAKQATIAGVAQRWPGPLSTFFRLRKGINSITITKGATSQSAARVEYRRRRAGF